MKYAAQAHTGLAWLRHIGTYDLHVEAMQALEEELQRQMDQDTPDDEDTFTELFWHDSQITPVDE